MASTRTVDVHIARLRKKLKEENTPRYIYIISGGTVTGSPCRIYSILCVV